MAVSVGAVSLQTDPAQLVIEILDPLRVEDDRESHKLAPQSCGLIGKAVNRTQITAANGKISFHNLSQPERDQLRYELLEGGGRVERAWYRQVRWAGGRGAKPGNQPRKTWHVCGADLDQSPIQPGHLLIGQARSNWSDQHLAIASCGQAAAAYRDPVIAQ